MEAGERRDLIERRILSDGEASYKLLAQEFGISEMTVRRDVGLLERAGTVRRVMGGVIVSQGVTAEPGLRLRALQSAHNKVNIAMAAVGFIERGQAIILDSGSTALAVARTIVGRNLGLTVVTPSVLVAAELHDEPQTTVILTGGTVRPGELSLIGADSVQAIGRYNCDTYFMGVSGVDGKRGFSDYSVDEGLVKQAAIRASNRVIAVADASKLGRVHLMHVAHPSEVDVLITDGSADNATVKELRSEGVMVKLAPAK